MSKNSPTTNHQPLDHKARPHSTIKLSVRNLVEFVLRSGDLDTRFRSNIRAVEGTKAHQKVQKSQGEEYTPEVTLKHSIEYEGFIFKIEGRADGIIDNVTSGSNDSIGTNDQEKITIDEIKSTTKPLDQIDEDYNPLHWAQAKCYAYIYAEQNALEQIDVQLTYYQLDTEETKILRKTFTIEELNKFFYDLIDKYIIWANFTRDWSIKRNTSIRKLNFPFEKYRKGQRKLAVAAYRTITEEKKLFAQAPTGIGKTISTIFPSVKAISEGYTSKIFYLTAKTITRQVAEEAFVKMRVKGLKIKTITLTAKDKICFKDEAKCNPDDCEFAKGHFDRVNDALNEILQNEDELSRPTIETYAKKYNICPFEFSLDLAIWADCVICDYNYVFDPRVYLKRFFLDNDGDYTFLIDEAHNLVDRSRGMFSAELYKKTFLDLKRIFKEKQPKIAKTLNNLNAYMLKMKKLCEDEDYYITKEEPEEIYPLLRHLLRESEEWLASSPGAKGYKELLELYFDAYAFLKISEFYDERYVTYIEIKKKDVKIKLFCLDPSYLLSQAIKRGKTAIFFSATLTPLDYFREILGGNKEDYIMKLASPFDPNNLQLLIANKVSTKYKNRENSYEKIAEYIKVVVDQKKGNYLAFFPSYKYMNEVHERFCDMMTQGDCSATNIIIQSPSMTEEEREEFLSNFVSVEQYDNSSNTYLQTNNHNLPSTIHHPLNTNVLGFAVLGGIFSEGIDLKGDKLSGAIIIGVGLPQICLERNIIRDYFNEKNNKGYEYSYMYPGMNKVLQAAGRVIRSETDKGIVLLIDERFTYPSYQKLFPEKWFPNVKIRKLDDIIYNISNFWYD